MHPREIAQGQRLIARADFVISALTVVCDWQAVVCSICMAVVIAALACDAQRLGLAACLTSLALQVVHLVLHVAAYVVRLQLVRFQARQELSAQGPRKGTRGR